MKSIPETILGKSWKKWSAEEIWLVRAFTSLAGGCLWALLVASIQFLQPQMRLPWGFILLIGAFYMLFLLGWSSRTLPIEKRADAPGEKAWTPSRAFGRVISNRSKGAMFPNLLQIALGFLVLYLFFGTFYAGARMMRWIWLVSGGAMIIAGLLSFLKASWARVAGIALQLIIVAATLPFFPQALRALFNRHGLFQQFGPVLILLLVWGACAGSFIFSLPLRNMKGAPDND